MGESHLRILGHWLAPHPMQVYTLLSFYPVRCIAPFRITHACNLATDPLVLMHLRPCACFLCHCGASPRSPPFPFIGIAGSQFVQVHRIALGLECIRLASVSHAPHSILHRFPLAGPSHPQLQRAECGPCTRACGWDSVPSTQGHLVVGNGGRGSWWSRGSWVLGALGWLGIPTTRTPTASAILCVCWRPL